MYTYTCFNIKPNTLQAERIPYSSNDAFFIIKKSKSMTKRLCLDKLRDYVFLLYPLYKKNKLNTQF